MNAVDYVLKPFDKARIAKAIQRAKKMIEAHTSPVERLGNLMGQLAVPQPVAQNRRSRETAGEIASSACSWSTPTT